MSQTFLLVSYPPIFLTLAAILGLLIGSFLNVVIYRLPLMLEPDFCFGQKIENQNAPDIPVSLRLVFPRSHCPHCKRTISWWHNIPLLSFLWLRGKCASCKKNIPWHYPLTELLSALAAVYIAAKFGLTWHTLAALVFTWSLIALIFIDAKTYLLPDQITLFLLWLGLLCSVFGLSVTPANAIYGAVLGYVSLWCVAKIFQIVRHKEGMGHGDFKLLAALGAWLGPQMLPLVLLIASLGGSLASIFFMLLKKQRIDQPVPFGPYLAFAGWLMFFYGTEIWHWYLQSFMLVPH